MKQFFYNLFLAAGALLLLTMCSEEDNKLSDVAILVVPGPDTPVTVQTGEKTLYEVSLTTAHDYVASYKVTSFDPVRGITELLAAECGKKNYNFQLAYEAPELNSESSEVTLTFEATDNKGNRAEVKRRLTVINRAMTMAEKTGILLFMPGLGMPDALSLSDVSNPFSLADSPTPESADVYLELAQASDNITWRSNTKTKFVRYNQFNYATATAAAIRTVYGSSVRTDYVPDVKVNDIIIVGHGNEAQGVFFVANVVYTGSASTPGFMQLSYKGIVASDTPPEPVDPEPGENTGTK